VTSERGNGHNGYDPTGISHQVDRINDIRTTVDNVNDMKKFISCRALDAAFDNMQASLESIGVHTVLATEELEKDNYKRLLEYRGSPVCSATKARVSMIKLLGVFMQAHRPGEGRGVIEYQQELQSLMSDLGVDGLLLGYLTTNQMKTNDSWLVILSKQPDGSVDAVWQGNLRHGRIKFQPVVKKPKNDDDKVKNVTRVYEDSFKLLVAELAKDMKN